MSRPRLVAELCAGTAALSLALQGGARCRPPVSRPGAKTGYTEAILGAAGLYRGQGADAYLWCEPEPGPRSVLACYPDPVKLREVEAVIRGWVGEDPRALWTRLRAEMNRRELTVPECLVSTGWGRSSAGASMYLGPDRPSPRYPEGWTSSITAAGMADRVSALAPLHWPPVAIAEDARGVRVEDVAEWIWLCGRSMYNKGPEHGFLPNQSSRGVEVWNAHPPEYFADRCAALSVIPWPPVAIALDARQVPPGGADMEGCICYIDPPYVGTTPYAHDLPRAEVLALARAWADAGALVMISEAVPVEGLGSGWEAISIGHARRGQKRTWGSTQEWLTMNRPPAHRVAEQPGLFAAAK